MLTQRIRDHLCEIAVDALPITYQALAKALELSPPNTIHQLTVALECLIEEDVTVGRPLIAALVISKARSGLPAPGFFECAKRVGCFAGDQSGPEAPAFFADEFKKSVKFWRSSSMY
jgi:hypothetical protein